MIQWLVTVAALSLAALAQWPDFKAAGAPRTADGRVNPAGLAPRAADGHPDLSGIWERGVAPGGVPPANPGGGNFGAPPTPGPRPFQNLPSMFPGEGLPMLPWAVDLRRERLANNSKDHPDAHCLPLHPVQLHFHPQPRKIIQTPVVVVILYESNGGLRQIFTDGRPLPPEDVQPTWYGYSVGKWEEDTLVVHTRGFRELMWIDEEGTPGTDSLRMTERIRRPSFGTLELQLTVDDPKTFTRPWTVMFSQRLMPDTDLIEFVCAENNRSEAHLVGK